MQESTRRTAQTHQRPEQALLIDVPRGIALTERAEEARRWAHQYATLGWSVTPSCGGHREWCFAPDRHPAGPAWRDELTTDAEALNRLWDARPAAYGVIAGTGPDRGLTALRVTGPMWSRVVVALAAAGIEAPVMRLAAAYDRGPERLYVITAAEAEPVPEGPWADLIAVHPSGFPLPLPAASRGGHAQWAAMPGGLPLPTARDVFAALAPLYLS
ncbi:bifunctional DNA primase/polymerase [Streptomyces atacamensis]|uniref:bifunctional DNA primase/polymerase n=1 Tax=Streptomyces atacamensis TaxID=531966 RepID=UPI00399D55C8